MDDKLKILVDSEKNIEKMLECCGNDRKWDTVYSEKVLRNPLIERLTQPDSIDNVVDLLTEFRMARNMGSGERRKIFKEKLKKAFDDLQEYFRKLKGIELENFKNVNSDVKDSIEKVYITLSEKNKLIEDQRFCVGATKIMHFLFPHLLIMIDSRVRKAVENRCKEELLPYKKEKQSAEEYIKFMEILSTEITNFGSENLKEISNRVFKTKPENELPVPRIMDKILWMIGDKLNRQEETSGD